jgi:glucokinase
VLAVDIGGTKLAAALIDSAGTVLRRAETGTPTGTGDQVVDALLALLDRVRDGTRITAIGVASAGPLNVAAGTVSPVNIAGWRDFPLVERLEAAIPGAPVRLVGDAIAAAIGEHWRGAGQGVQALLGIVVSTGIGGGLVLAGAPYPGPTGNAGHLGHVSIEPDGEPCVCGAQGCVERYASGPAMVRWAAARGWSGADARELAEASRAGVPVAVAAFEQGARALARGIVATATLCDLDAVVIGGGVAAAGEVLLGPVRRHVHELSFLGFVRRLTVSAAALGRDAGLVGAARFAFQPS